MNGQMGGQPGMGGRYQWDGTPAQSYLSGDQWVTPAAYGGGYNLGQHMPQMGQYGQRSWNSPRPQPQWQGPAPQPAGWPGAPPAPQAIPQGPPPGWEASRIAQGLPYGPPQRTGWQR